MRIYTSYYGRVKHLKQAGILPISISRSSPKWFGGEEIKKLAPDYQTFQIGRSGDTQGYTERFKAMLDGLDKQAILREIEQISEMNGNVDVAILCYEKVTDFCHRHIVAEWLNEGKEKPEVVEFGAERNYDGVMMVQRSYWTE